MTELELLEYFLDETRDRMRHYPPTKGGEMEFNCAQEKEVLLEGMIFRARREAADHVGEADKMVGGQ